MNKNILTLLLLALSVVGSVNLQAAGGAALDHAPIDISDKESLKRGAVYFADNCMSCHGAFFMRYNRVGKDLEMDEQSVRDSMIFTRGKKGDPTKYGDLMKVAMTDDYAKQAFGAAVPDLSLVARARGADWLYTYLRTFYIDENRPMGTNNKVFSDVGMPNVLWRLQGLQKAVYKTEVHDGIEVESIEGFEALAPGTMTTGEFDLFVADLVNFMVYIAEPVQVERRSMGWKVLLFLMFFAVLAYFLKKEYWKDIH